MTKEDAVKMATSGWWSAKSDVEIVRFQLFEPRLCMPWDRFQKATEAVLKRSVWTHEFAYPDTLRAEFNNLHPVNKAIQ